MSLFLANIAGFVAAHKRHIAIALGLLIVLALVLFAFDRCSTFWGERNLGKHGANVNAALNAVNSAKSDLVNQRVDESLALQNVNQAVNQAVTASNATDAAKQAAREALERYEAAKRANVPTGTTEDELLRAIDQLEQ